MVKCPQAKKAPEELRPLPQLPAQFERPSVRFFHLRSGVALGCDQRIAQGDLQRQLSLRALRGVRESVEQCQSRTQVGDRFRMGRPLHGLLPGKPEVFHGLYSVATATVVMRQVAAVLLYLSCIQVLDRLRRPRMQYSPPVY